jgi:putative photosynthetic complex assembly protein 2
MNFALNSPWLDSPWLAAGSALFLWWFSTGLILWRVRHADNAGPMAHAWSVIFAAPVLGLGAVGFAQSMIDASVLGAYLAFVSALAIWGWIELAFLSGIITGPNRAPCPARATLWQRFHRALGTILWHELLLAATVLLMVATTRDVPNTFGLWTFAILFLARVSAKLNLFFGVPRINLEFIPRPLSHLASHFRIAPINAVFPLSVTALTFTAAAWLQQAATATTDMAVVGYALLTTLTLLALLEHWFMILPLPDQKLWRWMLPDTAKDHSILKTKEPTHGL